jgi:hypothetical protein
MKTHKIPKPNLLNINTLITRKSQGVQYLEHAKYFEQVDHTGHGINKPGRNIRIDIYTDSYKEQGHCRLEVMDPATLKWSVVVALPADSMKTDAKLIYEPDIQTRNLAADFAKDREWLLNVFLSLVS